MTDAATGEIVVGALVGFPELEPGAVAIGDVALSVAPIEIAGIEVEGRSRWSRYLDRRGFYSTPQRSPNATRAEIVS